MSGESAHLATITAAARKSSWRLLGTTNTLLSVALLFVVQCGYTVPLILGLLLVGAGRHAVGGALVTGGLAWMFSQLALMRTFPEWPLNLLLCHRLKRRLRARSTTLVSEPGSLRIVELVPRENFRKQAMIETASDLMAIQVDDRGVWMSGDSWEYAIPRAAILSAQLESIRPSGWLTSCHVVVLVVRAEQGPTELLLCYRDHQLGRLTSRKRFHEALQLSDRISQIATGHHYQPPIAPEPLSSSVTLSGACNPYAAPGSC